MFGSPDNATRHSCWAGFPCGPRALGQIFACAHLLRKTRKLPFVLVCLAVWKAYGAEETRAWLALVVSFVLHVRLVPAALHGKPNELYRRLAARVCSPTTALALLAEEDGGGGGGGEVTVWNPLCARALLPGTLVLVQPAALWLVATNAAQMAALLRLLRVFKTTG